MEHATFSLVFFATGEWLRQCSTFYKRLDSLLAEKWEHHTGQPSDRYVLFMSSACSDRTIFHRALVRQGGGGRCACARGLASYASSKSGFEQVTKLG